MTKPIEKTDWATSGSALKTPTDISRWDFGWQTLPGNLPSQVGEKPNLQHQNYWQFAVHEWISYFDSIVPDSVGSDSTTELWEWDTAKIVDGDVYPWCNAIQNNGGLLEWSYTAPGIGITWADFKPETLYGAKYQELLLLLNAGLAIRIVDGSDTIYTINPKALTNPASALSLSGSLTGALTLTFSLDGAFLDIERDDAGVITHPSDFSSFVALPSQAVFTAKNPTGIRVLASGVVALSTTTDTPGSTLDILGGIPIRRTWFRPLSNTSLAGQANTIDPGDMRLPMDLTFRRRFRVTLLVNFNTGALFPRVMRIVASLGGFLNDTVVQTYLNTGDRSFFCDAEFYSLVSGVEVLFENTETIFRDYGGAADMNAIYGAGKLASNWLRIEEAL